MTFGQRARCTGVVVVLSVATTAMLPTSSYRAAAAAEIEEITWALPHLPKTLLVPHEWSVNMGGVMSLVQEGMLAFDDDLSLTTGVADSWEQVDPLTYVYHLRDGITFHDGSPVTAEDVVYSMTWHLDPDSRSQLRPFYNAADSIDASGDREITIKLKSPDVQFQYTPAHMSGFIMKKSQLEEHGEDYGTPDVLPLGTGPYKVVEYVPDDRVVLEAYEDYWGGAPPVDRITILAIPDQQTRLLAMRNGDIDGTFDVSISDIDQWQALDGVDVITAPSLGVFLLTLDQQSPPFDDIEVRRAIAHSLDRAGLVKALLEGNGEPAVALNPPGMWAGVMSDEDARAFYATLDDHGFDLDTAKAALAGSSVPDGFEVTVPAPNSDPYMVLILLSLAENLKEFGVTLNVQEVDDSQWLDGYFAHEDLGLRIISYFPDYADPANYPYLFLASANAVKDGMNASNYANPKVDELLNKALQESDPAARGDALKEAVRIANEEIAVVPIFWPDSAMAIGSDYRLDGYSAFWYNIPWAVRGFGLK
ncbi:MAG: ABC transporter substrate-binding protein [Geminicoccaceae bacterium]